jgi:hypothetical protein
MNYRCKSEHLIVTELNIAQLMQTYDQDEAEFDIKG